ncbi:MAG: GAF domain-containing protein [Anaerolineales bacterium]|nr:GAF domain-containing protein [Anaerolineales bacterium]
MEKKDISSKPKPLEEAPEERFARRTIELQTANQQQQLRELSVLHAAAVAGSEAIGEQALISRINDLLDQAFSPIAYTIWLIDEKAQALIPNSSKKTGDARMAGIPLGDSELGEIVLSGKITRIADSTEQIYYPSMLENARSVLCAPVKIGDQILGAISAESDQPEAFTIHDERFLSTLAGQFGVALVRLRAQAIERQRLGQIEALNKMGQTVASSLNPEEVFEKILEEVVRILGAGGSSILLPKGDVLVFAAANGEGAKPLKDQPVPLDNSVAGKVYRSGNSEHIANAIQSDDVYRVSEEKAGYQVGSLLAVPLFLKGQIIGVMEAVHEQTNMFDDTSLHIMEALAHWAAIAIGNAQQYEAERAAREQAVQIQRLAQQALEQTQKAHEMELARQAAEAANQAKNIFLANMSHELRTPLNGILGFVQLLQHDLNLTNEQREQLNIIARSGDHLLMLINSVLELSKIEAGRISLNNIPFDLPSMLDDIMEIYALRARSKGLAIYFSIAEDLPRYVSGDESKIRQVLINLVGNALKFTHSGSVELRAGLSSDQPQELDRRKLAFEIEDTGPGIAPDEIETIFGAFVQARNGLKNQEGSGLGLTISRQYARLMGGDITVESELGGGSVFHFEITLALASPIKSMLKGIKRQVTGIEPGQPTYRILIADDNIESRQLLEHLLTYIGFEVRQAANGREAIEIWETWAPHLIWLDMRMPIMDGYQVAHQIKSRQDKAKTVVIALTASVSDIHQEGVNSSCCDDFLLKPFRVNEMYEKMAQHLGVKFVYREETEQLREPPATPKVTAEALSALPADRVAALKEAVSLGNRKRAEAAILHMQELPPSIASALSEMVQNYRFREILEMIETQHSPEHNKDNPHRERSN